MTGNGRETLAGHLGDVIADLESVERVGGADGDELRVAGRPFAVLGRDLLEVVLDQAVATAAQRTPGVTASRRGPGWVSFRPPVLDRYALDRAEAWLRSAHRAVSKRG